MVTRIRSLAFALCLLAASAAAANEKKVEKYDNGKVKAEDFVNDEG